MWSDWLLGELLNKYAHQAVKDSNGQEKLAKLIFALVFVDKIMECQCDVLDKRCI